MMQSNQRYDTMWRLALLALFCFAACYAAGYGFGYFRVARDVLVGTVGSLTLLLLLAVFSVRAALIWLAVYAVCTALYFPAGWYYGAPNFKVIGAMMESDPGEATEFLSSLPTSIWLLQAAFAVLGFVAWRCSRPLFARAAQWPKKIKIYLAAVSGLLLVVPPVSTLLSDGSLQNDESFIPLTIVGFYTDLSFAPKIYQDKKNALMEGASHTSTWHIRGVAPKYKNYILIIGESARADYMQAYGFPQADTPFLSQTNGLLIDGYISTAPMTVLSIPQTLSIPGEANNNAVSLAKQAGFTTAWLSNQGMTGPFSSRISHFALNSDHNFFTQRGDYEKSTAISDNRLLPQLEKFLTKPTDRPRLIVLHLMGSHPEFCERLDGSVPEISFGSKAQSCYVTTIAQTDKLMADAVQILKNKGEPYSLIYFSDHGLKHIGTGSERTLTHGGQTYESFAVPFAKISSDDTEHKVIKVQRSAFNFLKGFSQWTGIQTEELSNESYDFFSDTPDLPSKENNLDDVNKLPRDPAA